MCLNFESLIFSIHFSVLILYPPYLDGRVRKRDKLKKTHKTI